MPATIEVVGEQRPVFIDWAQRALGGIRLARDAKTIAAVKGDEILAVVCYDTFTAFDCHMHIASNGSRRWISRALLREAFAYPFIQCGLRRVTGLVAASNQDAMRFDLHLGFRIEGLCREGAPDGDLFILGMLRRECRFIQQGA
jgi:RimJ/RimL family protein N-acetyltransferase